MIFCAMTNTVTEHVHMHYTYHCSIVLDHHKQSQKQVTAMLAVLVGHSLLKLLTYHMQAVVC